MSTYIIQVLPEGGTYPLAYNGDVDGDLAERMKADGFTLISNDMLDLKLGVARDIERTRAHEAARTGTIEYYKDVLGDTSGLNELLEHLGYEEYNPKWLVRVLVEGITVLEVVVDADSEEDAIDKVSYGVSQVDDEVEVDFDFDGDGEVLDAPSYTYTFGNVMDFLQIDYDAEEYTR